MPLFLQDFDTDFEAITDSLRPDYQGPAYAFARYGDGEAAILRGDAYVAKADGWRWDRDTNGFRPRLAESLSCELTGWHVGVSAEEHNPRCHHELLQYVKLGQSFVTFAEIFIFGNYNRFREIDLSHCMTIGQRGEIEVPADPRDTAWRRAIDEITISLINCRRQIVVSAGPWSGVLIHEYWRRCPPSLRQVIVDAGSAMDERQLGRRTRKYQRPGSGLSSWRPKWRLHSP